MQINRYVADKRRREKKRRIYIWGVIAFLALYFIAFGVFAFVVWSPAFQVQKITIQGNNTVSNSDIMTLLQATVIRRGNIPTGSNDGWHALLGLDSLFAWPSALPSSTVALIPRLAGVTISKNYFSHTVTATVTERQPFAVWCFGHQVLVSPSSTTDLNVGDSNCFWFDEQGVAFAKTFDTQGNAIVVIHDTSPGQADLSVGQTVLSQEFLPNLISIVNVLRASDLNAQDIELGNLSLQQINVSLVNGPTLYFSLRFPATNDVPVINSLLAKPGFNKLQYIDFTVENRAYYK